MPRVTWRHACGFRGRWRARLPRGHAVSSATMAMSDGLRRQHNGVTVGEYDVISGLSGVGAYLLCRRDQAGPATAWSAVIQALVDMVAGEGEVPRWHVPGDLLWDEGMKEAYPHGNLNCGLAHGIPGPLAFLSLSLKAGSAVPGLPEAITRIGDWLGD